MTEERKERVKKRERIGKTRGNQVLYGFLVLFILGYFTFFTSSLWLPKPYEGVEITPVGTEVVFGDRTIMIDSCRYSKEQKMLEIILHVENDSLDGIDHYDWQVNAPGKALPTKVVMDAKDLVVLHVTKLGHKWTELSVNADLKEKDKDKTTQFEPIKVYVNDKSASHISHIERQTTNEYYAIAAEGRMTMYKKTVRKLEKEKQELVDQMDTADEHIDELAAELDYQTEQEKMMTGEKVSDLEMEKDNLRDEVLKKQQEIDEYKAKIKLLKEYVKELEHDGL